MDNKKVADDLKRIKGAVSLWERWRDLHQEATDYSCPNRETFNYHSAGQRKNRHVFDSTAITGLQQFSNRIQSSLMPPWVEWLNFVAGDETPENKKAQADKALADHFPISHHRLIQILKAYPYELQPIKCIYHRAM